MYQYVDDNTIKVGRDCGMEEDSRDAEKRLYKWRMLALCPPLDGSRLTHGCPLVMDGRGRSEGVRGIERGIKLAVMPLANDTGSTGEEVICHHNLLQSGPRKWGDSVEPGKDITRLESVKGIVRVGHEECGKLWLAGLERMATVEIGIWSCYIHRVVRGVVFVREQPWFITSCVCKSDGRRRECFTCDDIMRRSSQFESLMFSEVGCDGALYTHYRDQTCIMELVSSSMPYSAAANSCSIAVESDLTSDMLPVVAH
jgi:hypothetical protein